MSYSMSPIDTNKFAWTVQHTAHLLRRIQFAAAWHQIVDTHERIAQLGLANVLENLLKVKPESPGSTSKFSALLEAARATNEIDDLKRWWVARMIWSANPIIERMTLVWHNHFATSNAKVASVPLMHQQNELLRRHSIGSFESMLNDMSRDPAMLIWLDGGNNKRRAPNENFARELFELFGLGIGNYTEKDIKESARSFTGWTLRASQFYYDESQHDPKPKTVLGKTGPWTGGDVVRITVEHPACARFIALKILREFAENDPSPQAIDAFATVLRQHKMEIEPSLRTLFQSEYFYHADRLGAVIKSPIQLVVGSLISLRANDESLPNTSVHLANVVRLLGRLGQDVFEPPNVKGWDGGRTWIQSATMLDRIRFVSALVHKSEFGTIPASNAITQSKLPAGNLQANPNQDVANANKINGVPKSTLDVLSTTLLAQPISSAQRKELAGLSGGLFSSGDGNKKLLQSLLTLPEYQLA